jgi:uncharacterized protein (AIM24 family)
MASFDIVEREGMHWVKATLHEEELRAEAGALNYLEGNITVDTPVPTFRQFLAATLAEEALIRPRYRGSGEVFLEPTLGGFHVLELENEEWILEAGSYWASEGAIELSAFRESAWNSFWTGDGLLQFRTRVRGTGKVVIRTPGPVELVPVEGSYRTEARIVVGRTRSLEYRVRRPTRRLIDYFLAGEAFLKSFEGRGKVLTCPTPYWRMRFQEMLGSRRST